MTEGTTSIPRSRPSVEAARTSSRYSSKGLPPAPPFPGDGPAGRTAVATDDRLGDHPRFLDRPGGHRLPALGILGDHGLEDDEPQAGVDRLLDLRRRIESWPEAFPQGFFRRHARVRARDVETVSRAEVALDVDGEARPGEPRKVVAHLAEDGTPAGRDGRGGGGAAATGMSFTPAGAGPGRRRSGRTRPGRGGGPHGSCAASAGMTPAWTRHQSIRRM